MSYHPPSYGCTLCPTGNLLARRLVLLNFQPSELLLRQRFIARRYQITTHPPLDSVRAILASPYSDRPSQAPVYSDRHCCTVRRSDRGLGIRPSVHPQRLTDQSQLFLQRQRSSTLISMAPQYDLRPGGDVKNKKQSMADLKLRRLNELNSRLREDLERPRIKVSEASMSYVALRGSGIANKQLTIGNSSLIQYCTNTKDFMVPSQWGQVSYFSQ